MWYVHEKYKREVTDTNLELLDLKGELDSKQAKISLAKFLRANLGFTVELISGIKLAPFQEVTLKGFFNRNFNMCVWGRGCGKTFIASIYCFLQWQEHLVAPKSDLQGDSNGLTLIKHQIYRR